MSAQPERIPSLDVKNRSLTRKETIRNNILAAKIVADVVRTTLGPHGMDKMLVDTLGDITTTSDGRTILDEMEIEHPAAKMMIEVAKTQDEVVGDGATATLIIAGELLSKAEQLLDQKIPTQVIISGYRKAAEKALEIMKNQSMSVDLEDKKSLRKVAVTAMNTWKMGSAAERLADIAIEAINSVSKRQNGTWILNLDNILTIKKKGRNVLYSELMKGIVLDNITVHPNMPKYIKDAKIALVSGQLGFEKSNDREAHLKAQFEFPLPLDENTENLSAKIQVLSFAVSSLDSGNARLPLDLIHNLSDSIKKTIERIPDDDLNRLILEDLTSICNSFERQIKQNNMKKAKETLLNFKGVLEALKDAEIDALEFKSAFSDIELKESLENINAVFCQNSIEPPLQYLFAEKNILAIQRLSEKQMDILSKATGAKILSSIAELKTGLVGLSKDIKVRKVGEDELVIIEGSKDPGYVSVLILGGPKSKADETERALHGTLSVLADVFRENKVVAGGGALEAETAKQLRNYARKVEGREMLAVEAFAEALEAIPKTLSENAGLDTIDILVELRSAHEKPNGSTFGVDFTSGATADMSGKGVVEPLIVKTQEMKSALEAASMILKIDNVIAVQKTKGPSASEGFQNTVDR